MQHTGSDLQYGDLQCKGKLLQRWIEEHKSVTANECWVEPCKTKFNDVCPSREIGTKVARIPRDIRAMVGAFGLLKDDDTFFDVTVKPKGYNETVWQGFVTSNAIIIENVQRLGKEGPFISGITQAVYQNWYNLEDLRYIFVAQIINSITNQLIIEQIYGQWPLPEEGTRDWKRGTPEYEALLGTDIGKIVAFFILGAFERGTRLISQVTVSEFDVEDMTPQLRLEIEAMDPVSA